MKKIFLCLLTGLCLSGVSAQRDWAQFAKYEAANRRIDYAVKAVFMGNSITDNWALMDSVFFAEHRFVGRGISGQTSAEMLVRFRQDVIGLSPEAVVIMAGTNDLAQNNGYIALENILGNIASMCELAKLHKIRPILCSVLPAYRFGWRQEVPAADRIIELNGMIERYARENGISYVDYHSALKDGRNGLPEKYSGDGVHPNPECYKIMEAIVLPVIDKKPAKKVAVRTGGAKKHSWDR